MGSFSKKSQEVGCFFPEHEMGEKGRFSFSLLLQWVVKEVRLKITKHLHKFGLWLLYVQTSVSQIKVKIGKYIRKVLQGITYVNSDSIVGIYNRCKQVFFIMFWLDGLLLLFLLFSWVLVDVCSTLLPVEPANSILTKVTNLYKNILFHEFFLLPLILPGIEVSKSWIHLPCIYQNHHHHQQ